MAEYTYKDVIIDPDDPRVEIGKEYYGNSSPFEVLREANGSKDVAELEEVLNDRRGIFKTSYGYYPCIIRKTEPVKKYVPFDLSDPEVRKSLRGRTIKTNNRPENTRYVELQISCFECIDEGAEGNDSTHWLVNGFDEVELFDFWKFEDGSPCGKLVEEW